MDDFVYEFRRREPLFHHPEFGRTQQDFEKLTHEYFYQIDAFGNFYNREQSITMAVNLYEDPKYCGIYSWPADSWEAKDFSWYTIAHNTYIVT